MRLCYGTIRVLVIPLHNHAYLCEITKQSSTSCIDDAIIYCAKNSELGESNSSLYSELMTRFELPCH